MWKYALFALVLASHLQAQDVLLSADRATYLLGQPIYVTMQNQSSYCYTMDFSSGHLVLKVSGPVNVSYRSPYRTDSRCTPLKPRSSTQCVAMYGDGLLFASPGQYTLSVWAIMRDNSSIEPEQVSNPVTVSVVEPTDPQDVAVWEAIQGTEGEYALYMALGGGDQLAAATDLVRQTANGQSSYRDHARYLMSLRWTRPHYDFGRRKLLREAILDSALTYSQALNPSLAKPLRLRNLAEMDRAAMRAGATSSAVESIVDALQTEFPEEHALLETTRDSLRLHLDFLRTKNTQTVALAMRTWEVVDSIDGATGERVICAKAQGLGASQDHVHFPHASLPADTDFCARFRVRMVPGNGSVGLMCRSGTLQNNAKTLAVFADGGGGAKVFERSSEGGVGVFTPVTGSPEPPDLWLELRRVANEVSVSISDDGFSYSRLDEMQVDAATLYVGVFVASGDSTVRACASVADLQVVRGRLGRYLRIEMDSAAYGNAVKVEEVQWLVDAYEYPLEQRAIPALPMQSNSSPAPSQVTSSDGSATAYRAYDGQVGADTSDCSARWEPSGLPATLTLDLGEGNEVDPVGVLLRVTGPCGPSVYRALVSRDAATWDTLAVAQGVEYWEDTLTLAAYSPAPVIPFLDSIKSNCDGSYAALFGYNNANAVQVELQHGLDNALFLNDQLQENLVPPTVFQPGVHHGAFWAQFEGARLTWTVDGRSASADAVLAANRCLPNGHLDLTVAARDATFASETQMSPRISVSNNSSEALVGFTVRLWLSRAECPCTALEVSKQSTVPCDVSFQLGSDESNANLVWVDMCFPPSFALLPGESTDAEANQFTVSYSDPSACDLVRYNDWSLQGLDGTLRGTTYITVYNSAGVLVYGNEANPAATANAYADDLDQWERKRPLVLNTTSQGANIASPVINFPVLVRLDSSNFSFSSASDDGRDIRFATRAGRPFKYHIETWDAEESQAAVWVLVDTVHANSMSDTLFMYWGNPDACPHDDARAVFGQAAGFGAVWHLSEVVADGQPGHISATSGAHPATPEGFAQGGGTTDAEGVIGGCDSLDGVDDWLLVADSDVLDPPDELTLSAWVRVVEATSMTTPGVIMMGRNNEGGGAPWCSYLLQVDPTQRPSFWWGGANGVSYGAGASEAVDDGAWTHVAAVRNGSVLKIYVNGENRTQWAQQPVGEMLNSSWELRIGAENGGTGSRALKGGIDELRISTVARSADWLRLSFQNQQPDETLVEHGPDMAVGLIAYDGFDYPCGETLHGEAGGTGDWGDAWENVRSIEWHKALVHSPGLTYATLQTQGNHAVVENTTAHLYRALAAPVGGTPGDTIWFSFIIGDDDDGSDGAWSAFAPIWGAYGYSGDSASYSNRLFSIVVNGSGANRSFRVHKHYANNDWLSPQSDHYGWGSVPWTPGDHLVVAQLALGQDQSSVKAWIDPQDVTALGSADIGMVGNNNGAVLFDGVRWHVEPFHDAYTSRIDEIRIGTTLQSVTPVLLP